MKNLIFGVMDCNNFFVSCERVFNPALEGKAVVVLSNNDGCSVSRSQEAKDLGIKMGTTAFNVQKEFIDKGHPVEMCSSNYILYCPNIKASKKVTEIFNVHKAA